jgi:hypothetical protein
VGKNVLDGWTALRIEEDCGFARQITRSMDCCCGVMQKVCKEMLPKKAQNLMCNDVGITDILSVVEHSTDIEHVSRNFEPSSYLTAYLPGLMPLSSSNLYIRGAPT